MRKSILMMNPQTQILSLTVFSPIKRFLDNQMDKKARMIVLKMNQWRVSKMIKKSAIVILSQNMKNLKNLKNLLTKRW